MLILPGEMLGMLEMLGMEPNLLCFVYNIVADPTGCNFCICIFVLNCCNSQNAKKIALRQIQKNGENAKKNNTRKRKK